MNKQQSTALLLIVSAAVAIAFMYFERIDRRYIESRLELHEQIIDGTAPSPYRYRILVPYSMERVREFFSLFLTDREAFLISYALYDVIALSLTLFTLFYWLRMWFSIEHALVIVLFAGTTMPIALKDHAFQPWSLIEPAFFTIGIILAFQGAYQSLFLLVGLAILNRETALFIPLLFLFANLRSVSPSLVRANWRLFIQSALLLLFGCMVFILLRVLLGNAAHTLTLQELISSNLRIRTLVAAIINMSIFLGAFWAFVCLGVTSSPRRVRFLALIVPLYLPSIIIWGKWDEVRLLMPLYPILLAIGGSYMFPLDLAIRQESSKFNVLN